jgi:hypothetical protein
MLADEDSLADPFGRIYAAWPPLQSDGLLRRQLGGATMPM